MKACWCTLGNTETCKTCPNRVEFDDISNPSEWAWPPYPQSWPWFEINSADYTNITITGGWKCPRCGTVNSPWTTKCECEEDPEEETPPKIVAGMKPGTCYIVTIGEVHRPVSQQYFEQVKEKIDKFAEENGLSILVTRADVKILGTEIAEG